MNTRPHIAAFAARSIFLACALLSLLAILALPVFAQTDGTLEPLEALKTSEIIPFQESQNGFAVAWIEVPYAAEYKLEVKKTSEGEEAWVRVTKGDFGPLPGGLSSYSLTGVATGLECNKAYDVRLGIRGDGESYSNVWVSTTKPNFATTTECAKGNRITNLRRTVEPGVVTLIWTAPTDDKFTGIKVDRISRVDDEAQGAQPPAQDPLTTLYESNNDSRTRYEDRTVVEGYKNAYIVTPIERLDPPIQHTDGTTEEYRAVDLGRAFTGEALLRPTSTPVYPRNVRFTQESRSSRRLAWETPADRHLTIEKIYRGETSRPVNDPWLTGYQVERREYILHEAERSDEVTTVLPESVEERLLTATMTVAVAGFTRGFDASSFPHMGALTQTTVSHRSRPGGYTVDELFYNTAGTPTFVQLHLSPAPPEDAFEDWTLKLTNISLPFSDATHSLTNTGRLFSWQYPASWGDGVEILVKIEERRVLDWETLREGDSNTTTTFTDNAAAGDKLYVYRVRAVNALGSSGANDNSNWAWMDLPPIGGL